MSFQKQKLLTSRWPKCPNPKLNRNKENTKSDYLFSNLIPNLPNVMRWPPHGGPFTSFQHAKAGGWWLFRTVGRSISAKMFMAMYNICSSVGFSFWAAFTWSSVETKKAQKASAAMSFLLFSLFRSI